MTEPLLSWLLLSTMQGSLLVAMIFIAKIIAGTKMSTRWHHALWLLLIVRLIFPWGLESPLKIGEIIPDSLSKSIGAFVSSDVKEVTAPKEEHKLKEVAVSEDGLAHMAASGSGPKEAGNDGFPFGLVSSLRVMDLLFGLWVAGALLMLGVFSIANTRLWLRVRKEKLLTDGEILDLLEFCAKKVGVKRIPRIVLTQVVATPALFGLTRPRLLMPKDLLSTFTRDELKHIFLHELAHIKRLDILVGWVMTAMQTIHWFNPFVWLAFRRMRLDRELATDGLALSILKQGESATYGRTIVHILEQFSSPGRIPAMAGVLEQKSQIKRRIRMISNFSSKSYKWTPAAVLLFIALACSSLPDSGVIENKDDKQSNVDLASNEDKKIEAEEKEPEDLGPCITKEEEEGALGICSQLASKIEATTPKQAWDSLQSNLDRWEKLAGEYKEKQKKRMEERQKEDDPGPMVLNERELTQVESELLEVFGVFVCVEPETEEAEKEFTKIKYRRATIYYEANQFENSAVLYKDIALNHSEDELGVYAANLYLDSLNVLGGYRGDSSNVNCYDDMSEIVYVYIDESKAPGKNLMKDKEFAIQIRSLKVGVMRKKAETLNMEKQFSQAAEVYAEIFENYKEVYDERGQCEVIYNLALNYEQAGEDEKAKEAREKMAELYPDCENNNQ